MYYIAASARPLFRLVWLISLFSCALILSLISSNAHAESLGSVVPATLAQSNTIRYVDADAGGTTHDGLSWSTAYTNIQDALTSAATMVPTVTVEIWVAEGVYYPDVGVGQTNNNISSTFKLLSDVELYGGFTGTENSRTQRNWTTHRTILSGDIDGDGSPTNNALHVLNGSATTAKAVLDGFVITAGAARGATCPDACGGGMYNDNAAATLTNLLFVGNSAVYGGAMYNTDFSHPSMDNLILNNNRASADGGAFYNDGSTVTVSSSLLYANQATRGGGAFHTSTWGATTKFFNSILWNNSGGDLFNDTDVNNKGKYTLSYGTIGNGCQGNINCDNWSNVDPQFWDADGADNSAGNIDDDFRLKATSPAVDAGNNLEVNLKVPTDYHGSVRKVDGNGDGTVIVDQGPYEYQGYDLSLSATVNPVAVAPGSPVTYTLRFSNTGSLTAQNVVLTNALASQVTLTGIQSSGLQITQTSATPLAWNIADIAPNSSGIITLTATVTGASWINSSVVITAGAGDVQPSNNITVAGVYLTGIRYVLPSSAGPVRNGTSWTTAFTTVQDALVTSFAGDEIWVAAGTYYPDEGQGQISNKAGSSFQLKSGIIVYGGFTGVETARSQRNWTTNLTVLSGDIDQNDTLSGTTQTVITGTNAFHVVTADGVNNTTILDGFTIRNGYANGGFDTPCNERCGAGIYNFNSSPSFTNLTVFGNQATENGGGIYNANSQSIFANVEIFANSTIKDGGGMFNGPVDQAVSRPTLQNVLFRSNNAGSDGGGMFNYDRSTPGITDSLFDANYASTDGGGIYNYTAHPTLKNVTFTRNQADRNGGGMANSFSSYVQMSTITFTGNIALSGGAMLNERTSNTQIADVQFFNNKATDSGGAMYNKGSSTPLIPVITNTTFISNSANFGGGVYNSQGHPIMNNVLIAANSASTSGGGIYNAQSSVPQFKNVTVANNRAVTDTGGIYNVSSSPQFYNTIIWGNQLTGGSAPHLQIFNKTGSSPLITYTLVENGCALGQSCYGVLQADPQFRDRDGADNVLATADDDLHLALGSPSVDIGNNSFVTATLTGDLDHRPRTTDGDGNGSAIVDLGAYEFQRYDLRINVAVTPVQPEPHDNITYTIWYSNAGPNTAENVVLTNNLPISVALTAISSSGTIITQTGSSPLRWQAGNLTAGAGGMITVTGTLTDQAWIINTATIDADFADSNTTNDSATVSFYLTGIRYVKRDASGPLHDGLSWATAYVNLQDAIAAAQPGDEVWVAAGVYWTDEGENQISDDLNSTFRLRNEIEIYGGFAGNENNKNQRNWVQNVAVLSGDLTQDDTTNGNGVVIDVANLHGVNVRHVVSGTNLNNSAVLDGFTITAGDSNDNGGGLLNTNGNPTLANLIFSANRAANMGGGMANVSNSAPTLTNVLFTANRAATGGGMANTQGSGPTLTRVSFHGNVATNGNGGGLYNYFSFPTLTDGSFVSNQASKGGAIYNDYLSSPTLSNVTFSGNQAASGSVLYNINNSSPTLTNATMNENIASSSAVIFNSNSNPSIRNSIVWGNQQASGGAITGGAPTIANSLVEGACATGQTCFGVTQNDPLLGALTDFNGMSVYTLEAGSSAVDVANDAYCPATDQRGRNRPQGTHCDLGAYEAELTDLQLTGQVAPAVSSVGGVVQYTLVVVNNGANAATDVVLSATLPGQVSYSGDNCGVGSATGNNFVWSIGALAVNENRSCVVSVTVNSSGNGQLSASASVRSNLNDSVSGNNQLTLNSTVSLPPTATATSTPVATNTPVVTNTPTATNTPVSGATATPVAPSPTVSVTPGTTATTGSTPQTSPTPTATVTEGIDPKEGTPVPSPTPTQVTHDHMFSASPDKSTTVSYVGLNGYKITIEIPAGAVDKATEVGVDFRDAAQAVPADVHFAGIAFSLVAYQNGAALNSITFQVPVILTLEYTDATVNQSNEEQITFFYYDPGSNTWKSDGITIISRDLVNNKIVANLSHFTEFGLFETLANSEQRVFLPLVTR